MNPKEDISSFIARFEEVYHRVLDSGEEITEKHRCYQLIESLPERYGYLIRELDRMPDKDFKFKEVKDEILNEHSRRNLRERQRNKTFLASKATFIDGKNFNPSRSNF